MSLQAAAIGLSALQGISQIQNARFQADLTERKNKQRMAQAGFSATEAEINLEAQRLRIAQEKRQRLRNANAAVGKLMAKPLTVSKDVLYNSMIADLADDLIVLRTQESLAERKTKAGIANMMASSLAQADVERAAAKANRQATIISAVANVGMTYAQTQYFKTTPPSATTGGNLSRTSMSGFGSGSGLFDGGIAGTGGFAPDPITGRYYYG